uniref:Uncharacterized protein n=1 Tax=Peronospora matthiolae TaxID=2874970 RepID=A0AAV1UHS4_9STRA
MQTDVLVIVTCLAADVGKGMLNSVTTTSSSTSYFDSE